MYLEEEDVLQHIPEQLREQIKSQSNYFELIEEKIDIAEKYIIYNILDWDEMPESIPEDIKMAMGIQSAILLIENYTLISPQVFGLNLEEGGIRGSLIGRLNSLLKDIAMKYRKHTIVDGMPEEEESFIGRYIIKSEIFDKDV